MKGKNSIVTAMLIIGGIRLWMQLRGKTTTPFNEWAIGYGALFIILALLSEAYPPAAGALAGTVVVGDILTNGESLFKDVSSAISGAETGTSPFVSNPFGSGAGTATSSTTTTNTAQTPGQRTTNAPYVNPSTDTTDPFTAGLTVPASGLAFVTP